MFRDEIGCPTIDALHLTQLPGPGGHFLVLKRKNNVSLGVGTRAMGKHDVDGIAGKKRPDQER